MTTPWPKVLLRGDFHTVDFRKDSPGGTWSSTRYLEDLEPAIQDTADLVAALEGRDKIGNRGMTLVYSADRRVGRTRALLTPENPVAANNPSIVVNTETNGEPNIQNGIQLRCRNVRDTNTWSRHRSSIGATRDQRVLESPTPKTNQNLSSTHNIPPLSKEAS